MLPEVGDLQRSSDVAEPSLMSHSPATEINWWNTNKAKLKKTPGCSVCERVTPHNTLLPLLERTSDRYTKIGCTPLAHPSLKFLYPVSSLILPFVYKWCVCVMLSCEAESQADSSPCWQGNTAGCLITACARQILTGASPLLTSQWHQMLCVYLHVHVRMWALVCVCLRVHTNPKK